MRLDETIFAESTPRGRAGISVIRVSGPNTRGVLLSISGRKAFDPHRQHVTIIRDHSGRVLDQVTVVFNPAPRSYTGEDLAEIGCHGNPLVVEDILGLIASTSLARPALPGEFTMRAFLNGKMDLLQAEAVAALIEATTEAGRSMARSLLSGELSNRIARLQNELSDLLADIEASFMDDDDSLDTDAVIARAGPIAQGLRDLVADSRKAQKVYAGVRTTIAGAPNVGKSSLFNALVGEERAIVHEEAGTTRDILRERVCIEGVDFLFHDTAGIRTARSGAEQAGVARAVEAIEHSDLLLYVVDGRRGIKDHERKWLGLAGATIVVMNKMDLVKGDRPPSAHPEYPTAFVSAKEKTGIDNLKSLMARIFRPHGDAVFMGRHADHIGTAAAHVDACIEALSEGLTPDVAAMDLERAIEALSRATGETFDEDILDKVFSRFCIGK